MKSEGEKKSGQTNRQLGKARAAKNDEFYTRRESIEDELRHYAPHFRGKVVYCNCDDPTVSEFWRYFKAKFDSLGLTRLITTCYQSKDPFGWTKYKDGNGTQIVYDGRQKTKMLRGDGDFRSPECVALLRRADIVVTNPPFSLFREYVAQLIAADKKFLIIGNMNAAQYKEIFRLIMEGKLWIGVSPRSMWFDTPDNESKCINAVWFTNLDHEKRHNEMQLGAEYAGNESAYPKYDNYDAIEIGRVADIPRDYAGVMGVPYSFLDKWNPKQFELLGDNRWHDGSWKADDINVINGRQTFRRLLIRNRRPK